MQFKWTIQIHRQHSAHTTQDENKHTQKTTTKAIKVLIF